MGTSKNLIFIATEGAGGTDPGDTYLSNLSDSYSNIYVFTVFIPHILDMYFNACNETEQHKTYINIT